MTFYTDGYEAPVGEGAANIGDIAPPPWHISLGYAEWYVLLGTQPSIHTGCDLSQEPGGGLGQPVYAVANGVVTCAKDVTGSSWRNLLVIRHDDPDGAIRCSRYGHLLAFAPGITPGAWVRRGQVVGLVGNADGLFYPHVHFDIARGTLLMNAPTNWPGDNYGYVLANYYDPSQIIQEERPLAITDLSQIRNLAQQIIAACDAVEPPPDPIPEDPPVTVAVKSNGTNIRRAPTISAAVLAVVGAGLLLHVVDAHVTADGHNWYKIADGAYVGGYIAQDVTSPN